MKKVKKMNANKQESWLPLVLVALASFIITLDATFMNVSISQLILDLNTSLSTVHLIISFYTLTTASLMLIASKLQDIIGKKKIFMLGALIYGIGAIIAALSQNSAMLFIGWSLLEGIGGALMTPAIISIIIGTYDKNRRTFALAFASAIGGIAAAIGPMFGGFVTTFLSWRFGFAFELAVIIIIFAYSKNIKNFKPQSRKTNFDLIGGIYSIITLVMLVLGVLELKKNMLLSIVLFIISIVFLRLFISYEMKLKASGATPLVDMGIFKNNNLLASGATPLVDMGIFKNNNLLAGMAIRFIAMIAMMGCLFAVSVFLQGALKFNAFDTGINLIPATGGVLISALLAERLSRIYSHKILMSIGFVLAIIGAIILRFQFGLHVSFLDIAPGLFLLGIGLGLVIALGIDISIKGMDEESQNTASGLLTTSQTLGSSIGTAVIGCILIIGATAGIADAVDIYVPDANQTQFEVGTGAYLEKLGNLNESSILSQDVKAKIVNIVLTDAMKMVMDFTAILLLIGLILTHTIDNRRVIGRRIRRLRTERLNGPKGRLDRQKLSKDRK